MPAHGDQVTVDRLRQLLDQGESAALDFKATCDLNDRFDLVRITKDVAAFSADGGHIVVGVNEDGTPSGLFTAERACLFDEAILRPKISPRYLPEAISLAIAVHELDDAMIAVVYVAPHPNGFVVVLRDGDYTTRDNQHRQEFRAGEVYVRRGTSSCVWNHDEAVQALERAMAARREAWRRELRDDLAALGLGQQAQQIARGPAAAFTWQLDNDAFAATLIELLRANDDIAITAGFDAAARDASVAYEAADLDTLQTILDRLATAIALGVSFSRPGLRVQAVETVLRIYNLPYDSRGLPRSVPNGIGAPVLWLHVITRIYAVGGLAVRKRDWTAVRDLTLQKGSGDDFTYYTNWLRHALTSAARANLLRATADGREIELSLLALAADHVDRLAPLRPDLAPSDETIITSLTQFDLLSILCAIADTGSLDTRSWYTNFARYNWARSEPALTALLGDDSMREMLFPASDDDLAAAIREVGRLAEREGFRFAVWSGWQSEQVARFLTEHPNPPAD